MQGHAWRLVQYLAAGLCLVLFPLAACLIVGGLLLLGAWAVIMGLGLIVLVCGLLLWVEDEPWWAERRAGPAPVVPINAARRFTPAQNRR